MTYEKQQILQGNLRRLEETQNALLEKQLAHIGELAALLCDEAGEEEIFFRDDNFAARYRAMTAGSEENVAPGSRDRVTGEKKWLSTAFRALLLRRLCEKLGIVGLQGAGTFFDEPDGGGDETVSYLHSALTDEAFRAFAVAMNDPKVLYGDTFAEVCEHVYYGRASCCILPVENSTEGRLAGFRNLMMKYGLKTVSICSVHDAGQERTTAFALLRRNLSLPDAAPCFFECRVEAGASFPELLCAADTCGMRLLRVVSVPEREGTYDVVFRIGEDGFCGFLSFLYLEYPSFTPTGLFGAIETSLGEPS